MTPEEKTKLAHIISVMQAVLDGKTIEARHRGGAVFGPSEAEEKWFKVADNKIYLDFMHYDYRIKREPRVWYIKSSDDAWLALSESNYKSMTPLEGWVRVVEDIK